MSDLSGHVVAFGECMVELRVGSAGRIEVGYGGDTLNTAHRLAELGVPTAYLTAIGSDPLSARLKQAWERAAIDTRLVTTIDGAAVGIYAIELDDRGERSFTYWRGESAVRRLFDVESGEAMLSRAKSTRMLYLSGITLSLYDQAGRDRIQGLAAAVQANGGRVAFDPNYRVAGWPSHDAAIAAFRSIAPHVAIVLPSLDDERQLFGGDVAACFDRWLAWGAAECVVKDGGKGAYVMIEGRPQIVSLPKTLTPLDTTGAGDAFNAGYLDSRLYGLPVDASAIAGHRCAGQAVMQRGALGALT